MLTHKQKELLDFIRDHSAKEGTSPSFAEMQLAIGLNSKSGVHRLLTALEQRGFIRRLANRARAIEIVTDPHLPAYDPVTAMALASDDELAREAQRRGYKMGYLTHSGQDMYFHEVALRAMSA